VIFSCGTDNRRRLVRAAAGLNGIDYVEVGTGNGPAVRRTLLVHFLHPVAAVPSVDLWHVDGGERYRGITVIGARPTSEPNIVGLTTSIIGDLSWYTLRLADDEQPFSPPPSRYDPALAQVAFTFRPGCGDQDCRDDWTPGVAEAPPPAVDYTAKDYLAFRRVLKDRFALTQPGWQGDEPSDVRTMLLEVLAYAADRLSYIQDAVATEAYLGTARRRISVRRHAVLVDYAMHDGCTARAWVRLSVAAAAGSVPGPQPADCVRLLSGPEGPASTVLPGSPDELSLRQAGSQPFEIVAAPATLHAAHNAIGFYTWSGVTCRLPSGTSSATLAGDLPDLSVGDVLVLAAIDPAAPDDVDARFALAHPVRLTEVSLGSDPLLSGPAGAVTQIAWDTADALPFDLALTQPQDADPSVVPDPAAPASYAAAFGNIVVADQGEHQRDATGSLIVEPLTPGSNPQLARGPVSQRPPVPDPGQPAATATTWTLDTVAPALTVATGTASWDIVRDLIDPNPARREAVLEVDDDGTGWLRFATPPPLLDPPVASYAVGNGAAGNVGARAISRLIADGAAAGLTPALTRVSNPIATFGGLDPETIDNARQHAPYAFRTQQRCITAQDYADRAQQLPAVQRAFAQLLWTGSWFTVCVYVDRDGGDPVDADFAAEVVAALEPYRMMGHDLEVRSPVFVPLDLTLSVCPEPGADWPTVRAALGRLFGARVLPDGTPGLFHPDRLTFGAPIYTGPLIAAALEVPGVAWADITDLRTVGTQRPISVDDGRLSLDPPLVPQLDNDPNFPDRGTFHATLASAS
jgi:Baseplate J-like protein